MLRKLGDNRITYGKALSDHIWEDNNGQLICRDAILARTGSYGYLESEIKDGGDPTKIVKVNRYEEDVFDPVSIASFENKPFCEEHPEEDVCGSNYKELAKGYIRDIRRGKGDLSNCLIGDIIITDPEVIELVKNKEKLELSLGYTTNIVEDKDGHYKMVDIRGNHLALVDSGRAGIATIRDHAVDSYKIGGLNGMGLFKKSKKPLFKRLYDEDIISVEEITEEDENAVDKVEEMKEEDDDLDEVVIEEIPEESQEEPEAEPEIENEDDCALADDEPFDNVKELDEQIKRLEEQLKQLKEIRAKMAVPEEEPAEDVEEVEEVKEDVEDEDISPCEEALPEEEPLEDEEPEVIEEEEVDEDEDDIEEVEDNDVEEIEQPDEDPNGLLDADELLPDEAEMPKAKKIGDAKVKKTYAKLAGNVVNKVKDSSPSISVDEAFANRYNALAGK